METGFAWSPEEGPMESPRSKKPIRIRVVAVVVSDELGREKRGTKYIIIMSVFRGGGFGKPSHK